MRRRAELMAVATTVLWSGSYIVNKVAFQGGVGPLTLAGLRYVLAALLLLALGCLEGRAGGGAPAKKPPLRVLLALGVLGYAVAQGLQYVGQAYLTPTQSSLCLSVGNTLMVMLMDGLWLRENQRPADWLKALLLIAGITLYTLPSSGAAPAMAGLLWMAASSVGYAAHMALNRRLLTAGQAQPRQLVALPMLIGGGVLLAAGLAAEGLPRLSLNLLLMLLYLSGVSGALGFSLWTASQRELSPFESSGINNLMLVEIALLDWLFFGRVFSAVQITAVALVFGTVVWIQYGRRATRKA